MHEDEEEEVTQGYSLIQTGDVIITKHTNIGPINALITGLIAQKDKNSVRHYIQLIYEALVIARHHNIDPFVIHFDFQFLSIAPGKHHKLMAKAMQIIRQALILEVSQ
jgi:hypothetical protein